MPDSTIVQLCGAIKTALSSVVGCPSPKVRKVLEVLDSDTFPICLVVPSGDAGEKVDRQTFSGNVFYEYPIAVALLAISDRDLEMTTNSLQELRQRVRDKLIAESLLSGVTGFIDATLETLPPFVPIGAQPAMQYDASGFVLNAYVQESR
jgi:hypothetical protein